MIAKSLDRFFKCCKDTVAKVAADSSAELSKGKGKDKETSEDPIKIQQDKANVVASAMAVRAVLPHEDSETPVVPNATQACSHLEAVCSYCKDVLPKGQIYLVGKAKSWPSAEAATVVASGAER